MTWSNTIGVDGGRKQGGVWEEGQEWGKEGGEKE